MTRILAAALAALSIATPALANDKGPNHPGRGWGVGAIPPGHQKKLAAMHYHAGDRLPDRYIVIRDHHRFRLPPAPEGMRYVLVDNEIYRVARDARTVVEAIGIVTDLLR